MGLKVTIPFSTTKNMFSIFLSSEWQTKKLINFCWLCFLAGWLAYWPRWWWWWLFSSSSFDTKVRRICDNVQKATTHIHTSNNNNTAFIEQRRRLRRRRRSFKIQKISLYKEIKIKFFNFLLCPFSNTFFALFPKSFS